MSRAHPTRAIVFDLDGTLLDSLPMVLQAFAHALSPFGGRPTMETFATLGGPPEKIFPSLLPDANDAPAAMRRLNDFNRDNHHLIAPFPGAAALLTELQVRGVKLALWTGRDRGTTDFLLRSHDWKAYFDVVVCGDDLPTHKPDPAGLKHILRELGLNASDALYLGDADVDVLGGVGAEVDTILIQPARMPSAEIATLAWRTAASPAEAYEWALRCTGG